MRVAVIGAGGIGLGLAALLAARRHQAVLWSPSLARQAPGQAEVAVDGALAGTFPVETASALPAAVSNAELIVMAVPGNAQRTVVEALARVLEAGQTVLISAMASLSGLHLARLLAARGLRNPVLALGTTVLTGRRRSRLRVTVLALRPQLQFAVLPAGAADMSAWLAETFGISVSRTDAMSIAFSNVNSVTHIGLALANVTRIERGEAWPQYHYMSEAISRLILVLDSERLAVAAAFGAHPVDVETHIARSFGVERAPLARMAEVLHARRGGPPGPVTMDTRYVMEDVPFGAAFTAAMGRLAGVPTPVTDAAVTLLSTLWGRDLAADNDLLPVLSFEGLSPAAIAAEVHASPASPG